MRKQKGFSLIELLIVVAIILIIAAITGVRGFCSNEDGVIRVASSWNAAPATANATCLNAPYPQLQ